MLTKKKVGAKGADSSPLLSDRELAAIWAGGSKGQAMPGLTPGPAHIQNYLKAHPLPPTSRDLLGPMPLPSAANLKVALSGGSGQPTQFNANLSANGKLLTQSNIAYTSGPSSSFAVAVAVGIGPRF